MSSPIDFITASVQCAARGIFMSMLSGGANIQQVQAVARNLQQNIATALQMSLLDVTVEQDPMVMPMHQQMEPDPEQRPPEDVNPFES